MQKKFGHRFSSWEEAESEWDEKARCAEKKQPLKKLKILPQMPGIATGEKKHLTWKSFKYLLLQRRGKKIWSHILKFPFRYSFFYLKSFLKKSFLREGDFFLYGVSSLEAFEKRLSCKETILVLGFSYCQKPFECPDGRFSDQCRFDAMNPICQQCDIGKTMNFLPENRVIPLIIPTVHYIGEKMFEIIEKYPKKNIVYLITACEMTLTMFADFGNMLNVQGVGVRLDGRICNTLKAFILSEEGIKPGLTVLVPETQKRLLALIRTFQTSAFS